MWVLARNDNDSSLNPITRKIIEPMILDTSETIVYTHAMEKQSPIHCKRPRWTPEKIKLLRRIYANLPNCEIARRLERPLGGVVSLAHKLRLNKSVRRMQQMGRENISNRWGTKKAPKEITKNR